MSGKLESYLRELEAKYAEDTVLLWRLKNMPPGDVDLEARAQTLRELDEAHRIDAGVIKTLKHVVTAMPETTAVRRIGRVLYWFGCGLAVAIFGLGSYLLITDHDTVNFVAYTIAAVLIWLLGRAAKYVLAGD